jgi:hypothetical protein
LLGGDGTDGEEEEPKRILVLEGPVCALVKVIRAGCPAQSHGGKQLPKPAHVRAKKAPTAPSPKNAHTPSRILIRPLADIHFETRDFECMAEMLQEGPARDLLVESAPAQLLLEGGSGRWASEVDVARWVARRQPAWVGAHFNEKQRQALALLALSGTDSGGNFEKRETGGKSEESRAATFTKSYVSTLAHGHNEGNIHAVSHETALRGFPQPIG